MKNLAVAGALLLLVGAGCSSKPNASSLAGKWEGYFVVDGKPAPSDGMDWTFELLPNGTFTGHMESHVMMDVLQEIKGSYSVTDVDVSLLGTAQSKFDDGYKNWNSTDPYIRRLKLQRDELVLTDANPEDSFFVVFRRAGAGPPAPLPDPPVKPSDPDAIELIKKVEAFYASLESYSDTGEVRSNGEGFQPKEASFVTRFRRPNLFLFAGDHVGERDVVWCDGKKSWLYMSDAYPDRPLSSAAERPLGNGLSILDVGCGQQSSFIPSLLMPKEMRFSPFSTYQEFSLLANVSEGGKVLRVLHLSRPRRDSLTLWIDSASLLIVKTKSTYADEEVTYHPSANPALKAADFKPRPLKS